MPKEKRVLDKNKNTKIEAITVAILTLSCSFANDSLRTAYEVIRVPADAVGQGKILSVCLFVRTTHGLLGVDAIVFVVDANLVCARTTQCVHTLSERWGLHKKAYGVVDRGRELGRRTKCRF